MTTIAVRQSARAELILVAAVVCLTSAAWALTADRMAGMDAGPGTDLGGLGWFAPSWLVMMAAMMLPALAPMVIAFARRAAMLGAAFAFGAGYLFVWVGAGLIAYAGIEAVRSPGAGFLAWHEAGRYVAAGVIAGAGLYQLTPSKDACLRRCRERAEFLEEHWRPGLRGALRMGVQHGGFCVGCSWALMAALFALGVMSLTWMALVAVLVAAERLLPPTTRVAVALVLIALGAAVALTPDQVPGLAVPGSAMSAMPMR